MRVMMIGNLGGQLSVASRIAFERGAKVTHFETIDQALGALRAGRGADLIMAEFRLDLEKLAHEHGVVTFEAEARMERRAQIVGNFDGRLLVDGEILRPIPLDGV